MKWIKRIGIAVILILLLVVGGTFFYWKSLTPSYEGAFAMEALQEEVQVQFDDFGVPHIYADNANDGYFILGYLTAQDRLFQIELMRSVAKGEIAAIFGPAAKEVDVMYRTLGIGKAAEASAERFLQEANPAIVAEVQAYVDGVNASIAEANLPMEYKLNGFEPKPYTIQDMYAIAGYMAWGFGLAQKTDPLASEMQQKYGNDWLNSMFLHPTMKEHHIPSYPMIGDTTYWNTTAFYDQIPIPPFHGSNAWAVAGHKTESGKPMLCNDTHIGYGMPQVWYESHLSVQNDFEVYGNFLPGIPYALVAHNEHLGWGMTMFENEELDFYSEKITGEFYEFEGEQLPVRIHEEVIEIKGAEDTTITIIETHHGPLIQNAIVDFVRFQDADISMRWDYLKGDNLLIEAFREMNRAENMDAFTAGLSKIHGPGLNAVYADHDGNIGWWACARILQWNEGVNTKTILDGSVRYNDPIGALPFTLNPSQVNPPTGIIYSANSQVMLPTGELYPGYYVPESRAELIKKILLPAEEVDEAFMKALHMNTLNEVDMKAAHQLEAMIREQNPTFITMEQLALKELRDWDGNYNVEAVAPSIFHHFKYKLLQRAMLDEMSPRQFEQFIRLHWMKRALPQMIADSNHPRWDDIDTPEQEKLDDFVVEVFQETIQDFDNILGPHRVNWEWGKIHTVEFKHPMAAGGAIFEKIYNVGPYPSAGGNETIMQQGFITNDELDYHTHFGPQMRIIIDFAHPDSSLSITPTGQSARRWSAHYKDQAEMYQNGEWRPQYMKPAFESELHDEMTFSPEK